MCKLLLALEDRKVGLNMDCLSIKIEGFRNIDSCTLNFEKITSLVSVNSYGKSNIMKAIEFAVDFINTDRETKDVMMGWSFGVPLNKNIESKNFYADFIFKLKIENRDYFVNYGFEFSWMNQEEKGKIIGEWLNLKLDEKGQKYSTLLSRTPEKTLYRTSLTGRCSNILKVSVNELAINKLILADSLYYYQVVEKINSLKVYIERHLDSTSNYEPSRIVKRGANDNDLNDIDNIPRAIFTLKKQQKDKYEILVDTFKQLFPTIEEVEVTELKLNSDEKIELRKSLPFLIEDRVYILKVKDVNLNQPISFERLSDGARRVFLMLTYAIFADIKGLSLIAFEEPENSIHPSLLQAYINVLSQLTNNCKIIIASHSPYILQCVKTEDIYIGVPNNNGIADFKRIDAKKTKNLLNDAEDIDVSVGNYIFELLSGSEDDIDILTDYLE